MLFPILVGVIGVVGVIIVIYNPIWFSFNNSIGWAFTTVGFGVLASIIFVRRS